MKKLLYSQLQKKHGGQFVARRGSKVLAWGRTLRVLHRTLAAKGIAYTDKVTIGYADPHGVARKYHKDILLLAGKIDWTGSLTAWRSDRL